MPSIKPVSEASDDHGFEPLTCGNPVSEGGLELTGSGGHRDTPAYPKRHSDQPGQATGRQPEDTGIHPDTPAPVSREVSDASPFETEREALAAARHITSQPPGTGAWQAGNHRLLCEALAGAGVELGAYDHRIVQWLAGWEPQTCAVIAGLITRAHRAGKAGGS